LKSPSLFRLYGLLIDEPCGASLLLNAYAGPVQMLAESGMRTHVVNDLAYTRQQARIIKPRLVHGDSVLIELSSFSDESSSMC
jgi:hypothetical protein